MSRKNKSWLEKFSSRATIDIEILEKNFSDMVSGDKILISTPKEIEDYIKEIPKGKLVSIKTLRKDLALSHHCDNTCPLTTGIFLRIVSEKNYEEYLNGKPVNKIAPFWRVIPVNSAILKKLSFGSEFVLEQHSKEGITKSL